MRRRFTPTQLVAVKCNPRGLPVGESHGNARHSDEVVSKARALRERGMTYVAIGLAVGAPARTVQSWCGTAGSPRRLKAHAKVVMKRIRVDQ